MRSRLLNFNFSDGFAVGVTFAQPLFLVYAIIDGRTYKIADRADHHDAHIAMHVFLETLYWHSSREIYVQFSMVEIQDDDVLNQRD